ncbi:MAG TPA: hypothetical protein VFU21_25540 [Kofleriaceae bacterium]|nr:hypothetical protein [Kofleriaceae bacterium]
MLIARSPAAVVAALMALGDAAAAEPLRPYVDDVLLRDGNNAGPVRRDEGGRDLPEQDYYPGAEHVGIAALTGGRVLMFGMGSYQLDGVSPDHRVQMFCAATRIDPVSGPALVTMRYVTDNQGDRYRNAHHPRVTPIFGGTAAAVLYNFAPGERAQTYMTIFGPDCQQLSERTLVMAKDNDDCSNSDHRSFVEVSNDGTTARLVGVYGCNGDGSDDAWGGVQEVVRRTDGTYEIRVVTDDILVEEEEERTRGWVVVGPDRSFWTACVTAGNAQPPDRGVVCSAYDTDSGTPLWRTFVARKVDSVYQTQIHAIGMRDDAGAPTGMALATWERLSENRRRGKGTVQLASAALRFTREGMEVVTQPSTSVAPTVDGTHLGMCDSLVGPEGQTSWRAFLVGSSINGNPSALSVGQTVAWNRAESRLMPDRKYSLNVAIDNGWLPNIYGQNPESQGRNFVACAGDVPNPGYGRPDGYQPGVKTFAAVAATSRRMDDLRSIAEDKLATELVLVPMVLAPEAPPPGEPVDPADPVPTPEATGVHSGAAGVCSAVGGGGPGAALLVLLLAVATTRRRRG